MSNRICLVRELLHRKQIKRLLRRLVYAFLRWVAKAQGVLWADGVMLAEGQKGLDIGCGPKKMPGFVGVDICACSGVDVICDLEAEALPFVAESFDTVYAKHIFEHIRNLEHLLAEISRVMKPGGRLLISVPYAGDLRAFQDPSHVRFFTLKTFEYFVSEGSRVGGWYAPKCFRRITKRSLVFRRGPLSLAISVLVNRKLSLLDLYESSILRAIPAADLQVELER